MSTSLSMDSNHTHYLLLVQTFYLGVSLIFINPGLVPQPEPYFDLTPIRVTHTKMYLPKDLNLYI